MTSEDDTFFGSSDAPLADQRPTDATLCDPGAWTLTRTGRQDHAMATGLLTARNILADRKKYDVGPSTKMRGTMNQANGTKNVPPNYNRCSRLTQVVSAPKLRTGHLLTFTATGATPALWMC